MLAEVVDIRVGRVEAFIASTVGELVSLAGAVLLARVVGVFVSVSYVMLVSFLA